MAIRDLDSVEYLTDEEEIAAYLKAAAEYNDDALYTECLADVARARAINQLAEATGFERKALCEMFTEPKNIMWLRTCLVTVVQPEMAELARV